MSRFFNIPRFRVILKCIRNYPKVRKCRNEAIRVKELGYYDKVPGQLGLVNDIIKNPEKHFKEFSEYGDIDSYPLESYGTYMSHRILQGAPENPSEKMTNGHFPYRIRKDIDYVIYSNQSTS